VAGELKDTGQRVVTASTSTDGLRADTHTHTPLDGYMLSIWPTERLSLWLTSTWLKVKGKGKGRTLI